MFDLLYLNGKPLVKEKFFDRRALLHENFNEVEGEWKFATAIDTSKMEEVSKIFFVPSLLAGSLIKVFFFRFKNF